jgi:hypothetical protein
MSRTRKGTISGNNLSQLFSIATTVSNDDSELEEFQDETTSLTGESFITIEEWKTFFTYKHAELDVPCQMFKNTLFSILPPSPRQPSPMPGVRHIDHQNIKNLNNQTTVSTDEIIQIISQAENDDLYNMKSLIALTDKLIVKPTRDDIIGTLKKCSAMIEKLKKMALKLSLILKEMETDSLGIDRDTLPVAKFEIAKRMIGANIELFHETFLILTTAISKANVVINTESEKEEMNPVIRRVKHS